MSSISFVDSVQAPGVPDPNPECVGRRLESEAGSTELGSQDASSFPCCTTNVDTSKEIVIASIQAVDVVPDSGRIPVGCYTAVLHSGLRWRTEIKHVSVGKDPVEWNGPIPIPSDPSATIYLEIYGSFEIQPILGNGRLLWKLSATVEQLLDRSTRRISFALFQENEDIASSYPIVFVTVTGQKREKNYSWVLGPRHPPTGSQRDLEDATDHGHAAFLRYEEYEEKRDLERSIQYFKYALDLCPPEHPCRAAAQSNLALAKLMYCQLGDTCLSLDVPLALYGAALAARPAGHPDRPFTLIQLAAVCFARFEQRWEGYEGKLAVIMLQLYTERKNNAIQSNEQLSVEQDSALLAGADLLTSSVQLLKRFKEFPDLVDLEQAILLLESFIQSNPVLDDKEPPANLGATYLKRYRRLGELKDLEKSISTLRRLTCIVSDVHPNKHTYLSNLGNSLKDRFERLGEHTDLEQAITSLKRAIDLAPDNHLDRCVYICYLGSALRARSERFGDPNDLDQAISMQEDAVGLTPDGHPNKHICLNNLANSFLSRFKRYEKLDDLDQAISIHERSVDLTPNGHPDKPNSLSNLGSSFIRRFERLGNPRDLEQAISKSRDAVDLVPSDHPDKLAYLDTLSIALLSRFAHFGELGDLEEAISTQEDVVNLTPHGHPSEPGYLSNLGHSFLFRFERIGGQENLDQAISWLKDAIKNTPGDHPNQPHRLNTLGDTLLVRFEHLGHLNDLEEAISMQEKATAFVLDDLPERRRYLNSLANSFCVRFERLGELSDLERAISNYRDAVDLTLDDHPDKLPCLNNLGITLIVRFERLGESTDLDLAISTFGDVIDLVLRLDGQLNKPAYLINFGTCLLARFRRLGELVDLEQAIVRLEDAIDLIPKDHPYKPIGLSILGDSLFARFESLGEPCDLEQAISVHRNAVELTHDGHVYKPLSLNCLGDSLLARYKLFGKLCDLTQAIQKLWNAIDLTPDGHPDKPNHLSKLADSFRARYERVGNPSDLERAVSLYSRAACAPIGPIVDRFGASQRWISCARILHHHSLLDAYSVAVGLLPQLAWIGLSLSRRYRELVEGTDVVREAAAAALDSGHPETAVEWLEQGRSIVWGELFQLRSSYDELSSAHPDHARRLRELSAALEQAGAMREMTMFPVSEGTEGTQHRAEESLEQVADRHRMLAIKRDKLLREIRNLPGFKRFLLQREFSQLRALAHAGPVVILNAAEYRCDALIVLANVEGAIHVPLPNYTLERSKGLRNTVKKMLGLSRDIKRDGRPVLQEALDQWQPILSPLWKCVVKPVLDALAISTPGELSRIFWCPTGPFTFLPIHAAGFYDSHHLRPGHKVFDFVVSSYIPTLSILLPPLEPTRSNDALCILAVRQPASDGLRRLPGVEVELEHIRTIFAESPLAQTALVESSTGTVEEVADLMKDADWVHFACHGVQDDENPTRSGLCLADGRRLQLSDMIALSRPRGGLAFLSACQTAMGDEELSDESIHIAAGMLFAGFGSVVGTMWSISDRLAPCVARDVYTQLFREGKPNHLDAAMALQDAIGRLRSNQDAGFVDWLPFIHVGL